MKTTIGALKNDLIACPECQGKGEVFAGLGSDNTDFHTRTCDFCNGMGRITKDREHLAYTEELPKFETFIQGALKPASNVDQTLELAQAVKSLMINIADNQNPSKGMIELIALDATLKDITNMLTGEINTLRDKLYAIIDQTKGKRAVQSTVDVIRQAAKR